MNHDTNCIQKFGEEVQFWKSWYPLWPHQCKWPSKQNRWDPPASKWNQKTHLHDNITDTDIDIDDYSIIRKDRLDQKNHWGGVLFYFRNHLEILQITIPNVKIEDLWLELIVKSQKLLVGCIYRPPNDKKCF